MARRPNKHQMILLQVAPISDRVRDKKQEMAKDKDRAELREERQQEDMRTRERTTGIATLSRTLFYPTLFISPTLLFAPNFLASFLLLPFSFTLPPLPDLSPSLYPTRISQSYEARGQINHSTFCLNFPLETSGINLPSLSLPPRIELEPCEAEYERMRKTIELEEARQRLTKDPCLVS